MKAILTLISVHSYLKDCIFQVFPQNNHELVTLVLSTRYLCGDAMLYFCSAMLPLFRVSAPIPSASHRGASLHFVLKNERRDEGKEEKRSVKSVSHASSRSNGNIG